MSVALIEFPSGMTLVSRKATFLVEFSDVNLIIGWK